jgi:hypothetical protein
MAYHVLSVRYDSADAFNFHWTIIDVRRAI